jgi:hypothetical protein
MVPQTQPRKRRNSSRVNLLISLTFHGAIVLALFYFAAREGLLGKQLKKIAVEMVKEKPPEKAKEPAKPKEEPEKPEPPKIAEAPKTETPRAPPQEAPPPESVAAPPSIAPPAVEVPAFVFEGGKAVQTSSDPVQLYKGFVEYALRAKWNRPTDIADAYFVAEVEVSVDRAGQISHPEWKKASDNARWDDSVRQAIAATRTVNRAPPTNFPPRILVRFDVQEAAETISP